MDKFMLHMLMMSMLIIVTIMIIEEALRLGAADLWKQIQTLGHREVDTERYPIDF